jgi:hypothetical protein
MNLRSMSLAGLLIICMTTAVMSQPPDILWSQRYGGSKKEQAYSVCQSAEGGFLIAGYTGSYGAGRWDIYLVKTDSEGDTVWQRTYGEASSDDIAYKVLQTPDSGYIVAVEMTYATDPFDIMKTDAYGESLWTACVPQGDYGAGVTDLQLTEDGGFIAAGGIDIWGTTHTQAQAYLVKMDVDGVTEWTRSYGGSEDEYLYAVDQTSDGGYILAGVVIEDPDDWDFYVLKTDSAGAVVWSRIFGGDYMDFPGDVKQTRDGGYIVVGTYEVYHEGFFDYYIYVVRLNSGGGTVWTRTYGCGEASAIEESPEGGFVVGGCAHVDYYDDTYVLKIDANGDSLWAVNCGVPNDDRARAMQRTSDGGYVLAGYRGVGGTSSDAYVVRLGADQAGCGGGNRLLVHAIALTCAPSPSRNSASISYFLPREHRVDLTIYDSLGRAVADLVGGHRAAGTHLIQWDCTDRVGRAVEPGVYFCTIRVADERLSRKIVLLR